MQAALQGNQHQLLSLWNVFGYYDAPVAVVISLTEQLQLGVDESATFSQKSQETAHCAAEQESVLMLRNVLRIHCRGTGQGSWSTFPFGDKTPKA